MNILKLKKISNKQKGFSLIELMISMVIGLIILAAVLTMFISMVGSNNDNLKSIRLKQDLRAAMGLITRDLRRAGFNSNAAADSATTPATNPFDNIQIFTGNVEDTDANGDGVRAGNCVMFSYNANDGSNELYGYQLATNVIESRINGTPCGSGWQGVTDSSLITITTLNFENTRVTESGVTINQITVTLSGELSSDDDVSRTLIETIKVRNDAI